jgi:hypothetical protein
MSESEDANLLRLAQEHAARWFSLRKRAVEPAASPQTTAAKLEEKVEIAKATAKIEQTKLSPVDEAASNYLGKTSKLQTALEAVLTKSIAKLDEDERAAVNRYREMKVFGGEGKQPATSPPEPGGDLIVCDDMRIEFPHPPAPPPAPAPPPPANGGGAVKAALLGAAAAAGLGWMVYLSAALAQRQQQPAPPPVQPPSPTAATPGTLAPRSGYRVRFFSEDGKVIHEEVIREK